MKSSAVLGQWMINGGGCSQPMFPPACANSCTLSLGYAAHVRSQ